MRVAIVAIAIMFLAIAGAVALMRGPDNNDSEGYTTEAYIMAVGPNSINICEQDYPVNRALLKVYDIDGNPVDLESLTPPLEALLTMGQRGDETVIKEIRVLTQYRVNDEGRVEVERRRNEIY